MPVVYQGTSRALGGGWTGVDDKAALLTEIKALNDLRASLVQSVVEASAVAEQALARIERMAPVVQAALDLVGPSMVVDEETKQVKLVKDKVISLLQAVQNYLSEAPS